MHDEAAQNEMHQHHNSFVSGFSLGVVVGAAGYFLFGTKKGALLRKQLVAEWETAKVSLVQEGVIENPQMTFREFMHNMLEKFYNSGMYTAPDAGHDSGHRSPRLLAGSSGNNSNSSKVGRKPGRAKTNGQKFKGV